jgi:hypothetical protein
MHKYDTHNGETDLVSISSNIQSLVIAQICVKRKNGGENDRRLQ